MRTLPLEPAALRPPIGPGAVAGNLDPLLRAAWHPVATSDEVADRPARVRLLGESWVLARLGPEAELAAFADVCPHRRAPLSAGAVVDGTLECAYHGWRYGVDGSCALIPALGPAGPITGRARLTGPFGVAERYGLVWLALERPRWPLPEVPEWDADGFDCAPCPPVRTTAGAAELIDNFLDVSHFSYLHQATFGITEPVTADDLAARRAPGERTFDVTHRSEFFSGVGQRETRLATYHYIGGWGVRLVGEFPDSGRLNTIVLLAQPEDETSTRVYKLLAYNDLGGDAEAVAGIVAFEERVLGEDLAMVEQLPGAGLPVDTAVEIHTRADAGGIELRRLRRELEAAAPAEAAAGDGDRAWLTNTTPGLRRGWFAVCRSEELAAAPLGVELLGERWVVVRLAGELAAFVDRCPHRLAPLSAGAVVDGTLRCGYHGWRFGADGGCVDVPALGPGATRPPRARATAAWGVTEHLGRIWIAPEEPVAPLLDIAEWEDADRHRVPMAPVIERAGAALLLDNQLDAGHFAFVHRGTFGTGEGAALAEYGVARDETGWGFTTTLRVPIQAGNDPAALRGDRPLLQHRVMTYEYRAPFQLRIRLDYPDMGGSNVIVFSFCPLDAERARMDVDLLFSRPEGFSAAELADRLAFEERVVAEDVALQRRFDDLRLPLDLAAEVHTRADRASVEMRRIVKELLACT